MCFRMRKSKLCKNARILVDANIQHESTVNGILSNVVDDEANITSETLANRENSAED